MGQGERSMAHCHLSVSQRKQTGEQAMAAEMVMGLRFATLKT